MGGRCLIASILDRIAVLILLIGLGYLMGRLGILGGPMRKGISNLILTLCLPCAILASANIPFTREQQITIVYVLAAAFVFYVVSFLIFTAVGHKLIPEPRKRGLYICLCTFANTSFVGFPIAQVLVGEIAIFYGSVFNIMYNLFMFTYGIYLLTGTRKGIGKMLRSAMLDPCALASFAMVAICLFQIKFPAFLNDGLNLLGNTCTPLAMLVIGAGMTECRLHEVFSQRIIYSVSIARLVVMPLLVFGALWLLKVDPVVSIVCTLMCALPSGSLNSIFAEKYDCEPDFANKTVVQGNLLILITAPLLVALLGIAYPGVF